MQSLWDILTNISVQIICGWVKLKNLISYNNNAIFASNRLCVSVSVCLCLCQLLGAYEVAINSKIAT